MAFFSDFLWMAGGILLLFGGGELFVAGSVALAPRVQERCHPSHSYTRGLEDMTNARIQRGRQG